MKTLLTLKSAINQSSALALGALIILMPVIYPHVGQAASLQTEGEKKFIVFEIKNSNIEELNQNITSLSYDSVVESDPLVKKLTAYLEKYGSPLSVYSSEIVKQPNWEKALAISFVESNLGKRCADNNCSGIGVAPGHPLWRKYATKLDWFKDMCKLLDKPMYTEKFNTFRKMKGIYVYPGSENWVRGAEKIYAEIMILQKEADEARILASNNYLFASTATFPELAILE
jgi:hypothetical protein